MFDRYYEAEYVSSISRLTVQLLRGQVKYTKHVSIITIRVTANGIWGCGMKYLVTCGMQSERIIDLLQAVKYLLRSRHYNVT